MIARRHADRRHGDRRAPTSRRDRGAVLVETALSAPLVFLMIFMIIELGFMMRDYTALRGTVHEATRAATVMGNDVRADFHVLEVVEDSGSPLPDGAIQRIVVFEADGPDDTLPSACLNGSSTALACNRYTAAAFAVPQTDFGCRTDRTLDKYWCPADRVVAQAPSNGGPPDYIGVYVEITRPLFSGLLGDDQTLSYTQILRLEPSDV